MKGLRNPGLAQNSIVIEARKKKTQAKQKKKQKKKKILCYFRSNISDRSILQFYSKASIMTAEFIVMMPFNPPWIFLIL